MALRNAIPMTFRPKGLSDALDGSNVFPGAMQSLANLVVSPTTQSQFVPRPAAQKLYDFSDFTGPGPISALAVIGTRAYGMVPSQRFPGKDEPFCYDLVNNVSVPISGVTAANCPATISPNGDWVPPVVAAFPSRILVTHPGFPGGAGPYFGWFDISSYAETALLGNTTAGSDTVTSVQTPGGTSAPIISGVQPGQKISGSGIPAGDTVISAANGVFDVDTIGSYTAGSAIVTAIPSTAGFQVGMTVTGVGPPTGATIASVDSPSQITMSAPAISTGAGAALDVSGGGTITLAAPATATATGVALSIAGGTSAAPLWGAGNTNTNPLFQVPICVGEFNGRAYFGVQNFAVYSDPLNPTQVTNASQALTLGDDTPITALSGLPFTNTVTGGAIQALIAFKGAEIVYQITGDADSTSSPLQQNAVEGSVGTLASNTICATPLGLAFMATDGLRILGLSGTVSDPIGVNGKGVSVPFLNALNPTRMAAAFSQNVYRISVRNGVAQGQPNQEYWFDFNEKVWTGPHSFPSALIQANPAQANFVSCGTGLIGLWGSTTIPTAASSYVENGVQLTWDFVSSLLPDNEKMAMNQMSETTVAMALSTADTVRVVFYNELFSALDTKYLTGLNKPTTKWGQFKWGRADWNSATGSGTSGTWGSASWGGFVWGPAKGSLLQYPVEWDGPLVFKQMFLRVSGTSAPYQAIGNVNLKYQICGYQNQWLGVQET